jgi:hypothetical protein
MNFHLNGPLEIRVRRGWRRAGAGTITPSAARLWQQPSGSAQISSDSSRLTLKMAEMAGGEGDCTGKAHRLNATSVECGSGTFMRAEAQSLVDDIKQSLGLLRRHL